MAMQCVLCSPTLRGASDLDANPTFNVVIVYEDFETGKHAKRTYDFLVENLGRECQFSNQMWKFDVLSISKLREMAVKDAVQADVIIISSHGGDELPEPVKAWIESWLAERGTAMALVALFECSQDDWPRTRPIRAYLEGIAGRGGMEFFSQSDGWPDHRRESGVRPLPFRRDPNVSGATLSTLAELLQQDLTFPHWGINE